MMISGHAAELTGALAGMALRPLLVTTLNKGSESISSTRSRRSFSQRSIGDARIDRIATNRFSKSAAAVCTVDPRQFRFAVA